MSESIASVRDRVERQIAVAGKRTPPAIDYAARMAAIRALAAAATPGGRVH